MVDRLKPRSSKNMFIWILVVPSHHQPVIHTQQEENWFFCGFTTFAGLREPKAQNYVPKPPPPRTRVHLNVETLGVGHQLRPPCSPKAITCVNIDQWWGEGRLEKREILLHFSVLGPLHGLFSNANKRAPGVLGQQLDPINDRQPSLERKRAQGAKKGRRKKTMRTIEQGIWNDAKCNICIHLFSA